MMTRRTKHRRSLLFALVLSAFCSLAHAQGTHSKTIFYQDVEVGTWPAITNVHFTYTTGGIYTNGTYTNHYRVSGTNLQGRLPLSAVYQVIWTGTTNASNSVVVNWPNYDGMKAYVVESSNALAAAWTNYAVVSYTWSSTNFTDNGTNDWTTNALFSTAHSTLIPVANVILTNAGRVEVPLTPATDPEAASKKYVDDQVSGSGGTNTLEEVLTEGNDAAGLNATNLNHVTMSNLLVQAGQARIADDGTLAIGPSTTTATGTLGALAVGSVATASGNASFAHGANVVASAVGSYASGWFNTADANYAYALGGRANASNAFSFVWAGDSTLGVTHLYGSHGIGSFNIYAPEGGIWLQGDLYSDENQGLSVEDATAGVLFTNGINIATWADWTNFIQQTEIDPSWAAESNLFKRFLQAHTNAVALNTNHTYTMHHTGEQYSDSLEYYMRLEVPLNPGIYGDANWTDYEIKIFAVSNTPNEQWTDDKLVYFYTSIGDPWDDAGAYGDTNARAYFVDDHNAFPTETRGVMKWSLYTNPTPSVIDVASIGDQLVSPNSVIDKVIHYPSHWGCQVAWTNWQWYHNQHNLRASYIRYDSVGAETNSLGVNRWQPLKIEWIPKRKAERPQPQG